MMYVFHCVTPVQIVHVSCRLKLWIYGTFYIDRLIKINFIAVKSMQNDSLV